MNKEMEMKKIVFNRMEEEYHEFIEKLKSKALDEIINNSYEKVIKEELLSLFYLEDKFYDVEKIKVLSQCKYPLEELYQGWLKSNRNVYEILEESISHTTEKLAFEQKTAKNKCYER